MVDTVVVGCVLVDAVVSSGVRIVDSTAIGMSYGFPIQPMNQKNFSFIFEV